MPLYVLQFQLKSGGEGKKSLQFCWWLNKKWNLVSQTSVAWCPIFRWIEHFMLLTHDRKGISRLDCVSIDPNSFWFLGSSKRRRKEELLGKPFRRPQHELDSNGLVPLPVKVCFSCNRLELPDDHIYQNVHTHTPGIFLFISYMFVLPLTGVAGWPHWSSVTIVPFCSTWTVWTLHSQLYLLANGCVQTMLST